MKYEIGDVLLIKSKIMPKEPYDEYDESEIKVCTSCPNGWDRFKKEDCNIKDGYVIHEVVVKSFDPWGDGSIAYHCSNNLSVTKYGWQGVEDVDVITKIGHIDDENESESKDDDDDVRIEIKVHNKTYSIPFDDFCEKLGENTTELTKRYLEQIYKNL